MQALEEAKRRAVIEQRDSARVTELDKQRLEVRSHVLALREGELDSRLRDRDRTIEDLNLLLRDLTGALRKEQATRESLTRRLTIPAPQLLAGVPKRKRVTRTRTPPRPKVKKKPNRAGPLRDSTRRKTFKRTAATRRETKRGENL